MNGDKKQMITFAVLGIALAGAAVYFVMNMTGGSSSARKPATTGTNPSVRLQTVDIDINVNQLLADVKPVDFDYRLSRIQRDPMKPLVWQQTMEGEPEGDNDNNGGSDPGFMTVRMKQITGIIWDEKKPLAVVDNEVVSEGYVYPKSGVVVDSILKDGVIFRVNDMLITVEMKEQ